MPFKNLKVYNKPFHLNSGPNPKNKNLSHVWIIHLCILSFLAKNSTCMIKAQVIKCKDIIDVIFHLSASFNDKWSQRVWSNMLDHALCQRLLKNLSKKLCLMCISHITDFFKNLHVKSLFCPNLHGQKFKFFSNTLYIFYSIKITCILSLR